MITFNFLLRDIWKMDIQSNRIYALSLTHNARIERKKYIDDDQFISIEVGIVRVDIQKPVWARTKRQGREMRKNFDTRET